MSTPSASHPAGSPAAQTRPASTTPSTSSLRCTWRCPRASGAVGYRPVKWGWRGALVLVGLPEEPLTPHRTCPSFQLCCCCARKNSPVCQSLDCLPDGQAVTLPVVRAWVQDGPPRPPPSSSLARSSCSREMGRAWGTGMHGGLSGGTEEFCGVGSCKRYCVESRRMRRG